MGTAKRRLGVEDRSYNTQLREQNIATFWSTIIMNTIKNVFSSLGRSAPFPWRQPPGVVVNGTYNNNNNNTWCHLFLAKRFMSKYLSKSATKRLPLTTKRAGKGYYKGKGGTKEGRITSKGKFIFDPLKRLQLIVPDLEGFKVRVAEE
jgi:hypothetical protein